MEPFLWALPTGADDGFPPDDLPFPAGAPVRRELGIPKPSSGFRCLSRPIPNVRVPESAGPGPGW
jgi:hypothetical protein